MTRHSGVYKILNLINGKCYVGSSNNVIKRWHDHRSDLLKNKHRNKKLQNAWNKYKEPYMCFIVLEMVKKENLICREQYWIDSLNSVNNGYNICPIAGNSAGIKWSDESKNKLSASKTGTKIPEETKKKMSLAAIGRPKTECPIKMRERLKIIHEARIGTKASEETRHKMRCAAIGRKHTEESKIKMTKPKKPRKGHAKWGFNKKS